MREHVCPELDQISRTCVQSWTSPAIYTASLSGKTYASVRVLFLHWSEGKDESLTSDPHHETDKFRKQGGLFQVCKNKLSTSCFSMHFSIREAKKCLNHKGCYISYPSHSGKPKKFPLLELSWEPLPVQDSSLSLCILILLTSDCSWSTVPSALMICTGKVPFSPANG